MRIISREKAMKTLYLLDVLEQIDEQKGAAYWDLAYLHPQLDKIDDYLLNEKDDQVYIKNLVEGVITNKTDIDTFIVEHLKSDWTLETLGFIERAILRVGVYEVRYDDSLSDTIAINSAIELAKQFADESAYKLINALLDTAAKTDKDKQSVE